MAITRVSDYFPKYKHTLKVRIVTIEVVSLVIALGAYFALKMFVPSFASVAGLVSVGSFALINMALVSLLFNKLAEPVLVLTQAINHVSKQLTDLPPPDINTKAMERSGLKLVVQTIYDLALNAPEIPNAIPTTSNAESRADTASINAIAVLEALPCGVAALNGEGQVAYANKQAPVEIVQNQGNQITLLFDKEAGLDDWLNQVSANKVRDTKTWTRIPDKLPEVPGRRIFDVVASYEKNSSSGFDVIICTIDRTDVYQRAEEETDFIALAAHELRGPITVIRGYLDVLGDELAPMMRPDQKELIDRLNVSANRLSGYINNILNVSRYDRRHLQLHLREIGFGEIINNIWPDLDMRARTQNRMLSAEIAPDLPTIAADQNSLSEVISNLVDNAIKYSNDGGQVIVRAQVKDNFVECTVQDFGIGIPASVAGNLFSKFYRSHVSRSAVAGTGLGLYISKAIIDSHGGQIWVRSTEGQGSIFGFTIPIYSTVADKLLASEGSNEGIIESAHGWIKNHAMVRK